MELQLVNFEQAKELEQLGFPQNLPIKQYYNSEMPAVNPLYEQINDKIVDDEVVSAPSLELVKQWYRQHDISIEPKCSWKRGIGNCWEYEIYKISTMDLILNNYDSIAGEYKYFNTYEDALTNGIEKVIRILWR